MNNEHEIALKRIKDAEYISYEGTESDVALLQSWMERIAKSETGAKIIAGLKKNEELQEGHRLRLRIGEESSVAAEHHDNGIIYIYRNGLDFNKEAVVTKNILSLTHELCHEEQFQQGIVESGNFTPEQNFIINRLSELDAGYLRRDVEDIKAGFEGIGIPGMVAATSTYNHQALIHSIYCMQKDKKDSKKSFEEIRAIYVKRLGVDIDPEYFSAETLAKSPEGKEYFVDGKLPIQQEIRKMNDGKLAIYKHPEGELRIYTPEKGNISIEEKTYKNGKKTIEFIDLKSSEKILEINQSNDRIKDIRIGKYSNECCDFNDFKLTWSQMNLPKDVIEAFPLDKEDVRIVTGETKENEFDMIRRLRGLPAKKSTNEEAEKSIFEESISDRLRCLSGRTSPKQSINNLRKNTNQISTEQKNYTLSTPFNKIDGGR